VPAGQGAKTRHPLSGGGAGTVPGGQGALLAVPIPATIQKKIKAGIRTAAPEIRCLAAQIADPAEGTRSTNGSGLGLIEITAVLFARLLASSRGGAEPKRALRQSKSAVQQH
jgi:hypothetical protein